MRSLPWLLSILILLGPPAAAHGGSTVHSENVVDAHNVPPVVNATQTVSIHLYTADDSKIALINAIYCRVQRYACGPAIRMVETSPNVFDGVIPWNSDFFQGVTQVGYRFEIKYLDGTNETSPISHYPNRPLDLPAGADTYYYYTLNPPPESAPAAPTLWILVFTLALLAWRKRQ